MATFEEIHTFGPWKFGYITENGTKYAVILSADDPLISGGGPPSAEPTVASTYTVDGITWQFWDAETGGNAKNVNIYVGAEGAPSIEADDNTWFDTDVPSVQVAHTDFTGNNGSSGTGVTVSGSKWAHGMMRDPWFASSDNQGFDELLWYWESGGGPGTSACQTWDSTKNIDPGATGVRVRANTVGSYVKSKRVSAMTTPTDWTTIEQFSVLHVLSSVPVAGFFSPPACSNSKSIILTTDDIDKAAVLGAGFTLASGMPTLEAAQTNNYFRSGLQPFWGQSGEKRRRMMTVDTGLVANGYAGGGNGYGRFFSEWFHAMRAEGSSVDDAVLYKALRLGIELIGNAHRGYDMNGGAGQHVGHKQFAQLVAHFNHDLVADALTLRSGTTHQPFWVTNDFVGGARGGFNSVSSNHDIRRGTHYSSHVGRPDWYQEPESGVYPHDPANTDFDSNQGSDYNFTAGYVSFLEMLNIGLLQGGPNGWDGYQVIAQSESDFSSSNDLAACIAYWDLYRTFCAAQSAGTSPFDLVAYELEYATAYDERRGDSEVPKWTGVPYAFSAYNNTSPWLVAATNGWSWDLEQTAQPHLAAWHDQTITRVDMRYSLDGRSYVTENNIGLTGSKTTGVPVGVEAQLRFIGHNSHGQGIEPVNYPWKTDDVNKRLRVTPNGTPSGTPTVVANPTVVVYTYDDWKGDEYTAAPASALVGQLLFAAVGWWTGDLTGGFTYQWTRDGVDIGGATSSSYTTQAADVGTDIGCKITNGVTTQATSNVVNIAARTEGSTTITYVGGKSVNRTATNVSLTDLTGGLAAAPAEGDLVVLFISAGSNTDRDIAVSTAGYTEVVDINANSTHDAQLGVFYKRMGAVPDTSFTYTTGVGSVGAQSVQVQVWRGVDAVTPMDVAAVTATGVDSRRADPPGITPSTSGAVILAGGSGAYADASGADTLTTTDLGNFLTTNDLGGTTQACVGAVGKWIWDDNGEFNPAAFGSTNNNAGESWCAATIALRPA